MQKLTNIARLVVLFGLMGGLGACGASGDSSSAYANVTVTFDDSIVVDQLQFEALFNDQRLGDAAMRPDTAGAPLKSGITVTIVLPDQVQGKNVSFRATGFYQGVQVTSGRIDNIVPLPGRGVDVPIVLGHVLQSFTADPTSLNEAVGTTTRIIASATFADENDGDVSEQTTWTSSNPAVITVSTDAGTRGLTKALTEGTATITATLQDQTLTIPVTVSARRLTSLNVAPIALVIPQGQTAKLQATATYSDNSSTDVSADADWVSTNTSVVAVDKGNLTTGTTGQVQVTATYQGSSASATVTVINPTLASISIEPPSAKIAKGFTRQYLAYGIYTDGSRLNITSSVSFSVDPPDLASFNGSGLLTGITPGEVTITVVGPGSVTATSTATITAATLVSFTIAPTTPTAPLGVPVTFQATGVYSDGTDSDITGLCAWTSSNPSVASVPAGSSTYSTNAVGTTTVTATPPSGSTPQPVTTVLTVTSAVLDHISVAPSSSTIAKGQTATFTATGVLTDGTTVPLTTTATWTSSNTGVATMASNVATAKAVGSTTIKATANGKQGTALLTVTDAQLLSIDVAPSPVSIIVATTQTMTATGNYTDGSRSISDQVTWSITDANPDDSAKAVATIGAASGIVTGVSSGTATVKATLSGVSGTSALTVTAAVLTSIDVLPANPSVIVGNTVQLQAKGHYNNSTTQDITTTVQWASTDVTKATVGNATTPMLNKGLVTGVAGGSPSISASVGAISGAQIVSVSDAVVTSVTIDQASPQTLSSGATGQLTATAHYNNGNDVDVTKQGSWNSSNTAVATIDSGTTFGGRVNVLTGITVAMFTNATVGFGGKTSPIVQVNINPATLQSITVTPNPLSQIVGDTSPLTATGTYSDTSTRIITTDAALTWSIPVAQQVTATISNAAGQKGAVTALAAGTATATATLSGVSGTADISVAAVTTTSVSVTCDSSTVANGNSVQCHGDATRNNGTHADITQSCLWALDGASTATGTVTSGTGNPLAGGGVFTSASTGTARTTCTTRTSHIAGTSPQITVTAAVLKRVDVSPATATVSLAGVDTQQYTASAVLTDNTSSDVTTSPQCTFDTDHHTIATCDSNGLCTGVAAGTVTVTATYQTMSGTASLEVDP